MSQICMGNGLGEADLEQCRDGPAHRSASRAGTWFKPDSGTWWDPVVGENSQTSPLPSVRCRSEGGEEATLVPTAGDQGWAVEIEP
jgi:hypothetical protein